MLVLQKTLAVVMVNGFDIIFMHNLDIEEKDQENRFYAF